MSDSFFERPILNSPYEYPSRHWELDEHGKPTSVIAPDRRAAFITPIRGSQRRKASPKAQMPFEETPSENRVRTARK